MFHLLQSIARSLAYDPIVRFYSLASIALLCGLLIAKEILRAYDSPRGRRWLHRLDLAIVPLAFAFGFAMLIRFLSL